MYGVKDASGDPGRERDAMHYAYRKEAVFVPFTKAKCGLRLRLAAIVIK